MKIKILLSSMFFGFIMILSQPIFADDACDGSRNKSGDGASTYQVGQGFCCDCDAASSSCECDDGFEG